MTPATAERAILARLGSLADETRGRLLLLLEESEFTVTELCQVLQLPQPTVSRHLALLAREGWVTMRVEGRNRHYRLSPSLDPGASRLWAAVRGELSESRGAAEDRTRSRSVLEARAERSRVFFASQAGRWDQLRRELFGEGADLLLLPALLDPDQVVGDLGCGTGRLTRLLAPFAGRVLAIDRSPEMLALARSRSCDLENVEICEGELEALPLADGSLDVAILTLVLHYVVDPGRALREAFRVLRPGGRLLLLDMERHERAAFREEMGHLWLGFTPEELHGWLTAAGFEAPTVAPLPADPGAEGPLLFALRARRPAIKSSEAKSRPRTRLQRLS